MLQLIGVVMGQTILLETSSQVLQSLDLTPWRNQNITINTGFP